MVSSDKPVTPNQSPGDMKVWGLGSPNEYSWVRINTAALWGKNRYCAPQKKILLTSKLFMEKENSLNMLVVPFK